MSNEKAESDKRYFEGKQREMERAHDAMKDLARQASEATVQSGQLAARTIMLINGGAAVAMLAFLGNIARGQQSFSNAIDSLMFFAIGVWCGALALGATYCSNFCSSRALGALDLVRDHPYFREERATKRWRWGAVFFMIAAVISGIAGLVLFVAGTWAIRGSVIALAK